VLWTASWRNKIPRQAGEAIERANSIYISSVSIFEGLNRQAQHSFLRVRGPTRQIIGGRETIAHVGAWCRSYDIAAAHADPFDRLLLAQAIVEPL
jgi:PIN domain nuclease of toxin-antitoxin system